MLDICIYMQMCKLLDQLQLNPFSGGPFLYVRIWGLKTFDSKVWKRSPTERIKIFLIGIQMKRTYPTKTFMMIFNY